MRSRRFLTWMAPPSHSVIKKLKFLDRDGFRPVPTLPSAPRPTWLSAPRLRNEPLRGRSSCQARRPICGVTDWWRANQRVVLGLRHEGLIDALALPAPGR